MVDLSWDVETPPPRPYLIGAGSTVIESYLIPFQTCNYSIWQMEVFQHTFLYSFEVSFDQILRAEKKVNDDSIQNFEFFLAYLLNKTE